MEIIDITPADVHDVRISVSAELSEHYGKIIEIRNTIIDNPESEDKSLVSILNATTTIIKELAKIQQDLYNSETFAVLQQVIVQVLRESDKKVAEKVLKALEERELTI